VRGDVNDFRLPFGKKDLVHPVFEIAARVKGPEHGRDF
jgi:hypothetical protein